MLNASMFVALGSVLAKFPYRVVHEHRAVQVQNVADAAAAYQHKDLGYTLVGEVGEVAFLYTPFDRLELVLSPTPPHHAIAAETAGAFVELLAFIEVSRKFRRYEKEGVKSGTDTPQLKHQMFRDLTSGKVIQAIWRSEAKFPDLWQPPAK